ncbi:MAG: TIGR03619 family F420-dependent LLM class oxidoreductase [Gammaproteobacteria bacterium]|jgi:probable F420-dependent oxidoreductase|nr:TIGR03619 family F420-dependent LLM class oxidoreductase [Gammaproteobacteria bacterium]
MKYGFSLIVRGNDATPDSFARIAERAEALDIDSLWCSAHVVLPPQVKSGYVLMPGVMHPEHWKERYWEPFTVLSYLAAVTSKITLGTSVVIVPMHNPFELAKQVAEVDQLSGGRFVFGIGVGWFEEEFEVLGQDFHNRGARTDEAIELMKVLWAEDPVSFAGKHYRVENAFFAPKPVQQPSPPIWVAGGSKAALKRAARCADAWHPARPSLENLREARVVLNGYLEEVGRSPESLEIAVKLPLIFQDGPPASGQPPTQGRVTDIIDAIEAYREAGASQLVLDFVPESLTTALDTMERFAQEVRPRLSQS